MYFVYRFELSSCRAVVLFFLVVCCYNLNARYYLTISRKKAERLIAIENKIFNYYNSVIRHDFSCDVIT